MEPAGAASFEAMRRASEAFQRGGVSLPAILGLAERVRRATAGQAPDRGTVVVATVEGDVHHIGKSLLVTLLGAAGYRVVDLGKQVPVEAIVEAVVDTGAEALALSALLVSTSKQMPRCIQALDARGVHVPVLLGGAAINRAFGRRAAVLPDGRIYEPGVFYCRDVFEGVAVLEAWREPRARAALVEQLRAAIAADAEGVEAPRAAPRVAEGTRESAVVRAVDVPRPPYWGARRIEVELAAVWPYLDRNTLFRHHWGGYPLRGPDYERLVDEEFEPRLAALQAEAARDGWLAARVVAGYWPCRSAGEQLIVFDAEQAGVERVRLDFPRQAEGARLCLADFFSSEGDVVALQAVSAGAAAGAYVESLQRAGEYVRMLEVNGLAAATAEALAEYAHDRARRELGLPVGRSLRFSWGYPACPDLSEQRKVLPLLEAERLIGLRLSASDNLDPEHSTAAMIVHHPQVSYFAVRSGQG